MQFVYCLTQRVDVSTEQADDGEMWMPDRNVLQPKTSACGPRRRALLTGFITSTIANAGEKLYENFNYYSYI